MDIIEVSPGIYNLLIITTSFITGFGFCGALIYMMWKEKPAGDFLQIREGQTITVRGAGDE